VGALTNPGSGVAPGTVAHFAANEAPPGWLKANGAAVSRTAYAALFQAIGTTYGAGDGTTTFNLPDLRGEFLRGWDDGRGVDGGRAFGSAQQSQNITHTHGVNDPSHGHVIGGGVLGSYKSPPAQVDDTVTSAAGWDVFYNTWTQGSFTGITIQNSGGTEARPRNIALLACIKF
jgi:microcystin-dependent protein